MSGLEPECAPPFLASSLEFRHYWLLRSVLKDMFNVNRAESVYRLANIVTYSLLTPPYRDVISISAWSLTSSFQVEITAAGLHYPVGEPSGRASRRLLRITLQSSGTGQSSQPGSRAGAALTAAFPSVIVQPHLLTGRVATSDPHRLQR